MRINGRMFGAWRGSASVKVCGGNPPRQLLRCSILRSRVLSDARRRRKIGIDLSRGRTSSKLLSSEKFP